jgi:iron complex outermembrane receptor protein
MLRYLITLIWLICTFHVFTQSSGISGEVVDAETGEYLFAANIRVGTAGAVTDFDGKFEIALDPGTYDVEVSYVGFESQTVEVEVSEGAFTPVEFRMSTSNNLLNTATVTGSRYEQRIAESVVSIEVLKPALIENTNTTNIEDIFNKIPGVQIIDGQPNIRGGSGWAYNAGNRVMLLIDDIPALQPDAGRAQWTDVPVENIAQIEVIKGAGSTMYGSAAMNGVINVRTDYATSEPETKVSLFHTRFDSYKDERKNWYDHTPQDFGLSASHKRKVGKWDIVAAAFYYDQDSSKAYRDQDFRYKLRGNLNIRYRATDRITAGVNTIVNKGNSSSYFLWKNGSTGALEPFAGTVTTSENLRYIIDPYMTIFDKKNNKHRFHGRIYNNDNDNNLNQSNRSLMIYGEYQFHRAFDEFGINLASGIVGSTVDSDAQFFSNADIKHNNFAGYFQLDKNFGERLNLSGGIRYEYNKQKNTEIQHSQISVPAEEREEGQFIGRFGLNYMVSEETFLRASIGQGYRYPILIERFLSTEFGGFIILPNPDLESERGMTAELGIKQGFRLLGLQGYLDVAGFIQRYNRMMEFTFVTEPTFGFKSLNIGDTEIKGFEFGIAANSTIFNVPIFIYGGYAYMNPTYQEFTDQLRDISSVEENVLKYRTRHSYSIDIQADYKNVMFGIALQGASHMVAIDKILETFIPDLRSYREVNDSGYTVFDARLGYSFEPFRVSIHLKNILNSEYTQRPGLIEAPRNLAIRMDWKI